MEWIKIRKSIKTFYETYADRNSEADMQSYIQENFNEQLIVSQLQNPNAEFFIAWENNQPIGYLKVNTAEAQTDLKETDSLEINISSKWAVSYRPIR